MAIIVGKNGNNNLVGTNKDDLILGLGGNDTLSGGNGNDLLFGGHGNDVVGGGSGNDLLVGGDGNDSLTGGSGADLLTGGAGRDHFIYQQATDSSVAAGWDRILDFTQGKDKIDLSAFRNGSSNLDLIWKGEDPAVPGAWGVWYHNGWNSTTIYADTSGDGIADFKIELKNTCGLNLVASDFIGVSDAQVNNAPVAVADTLAATEDTQVTYTAAQLLGNDDDGDPELVQTLTIASVTSGTGGSAVLNGNGTVTFTPDLNFNGAANFTYTVSDGLATSAAATVTVNVAAVNDAPVAVADTLAATEDTPVTYTAAQLLGNDEDGDPELVQPLTIASVTSGTGGAAVLNVDGTVTFTPNVNFNGAANFSYTVSDDLATSAAATVTVNVAAVNDAPAAVADTLAATEDTPVTYTAAQLLGNDEDGDPELVQTLTIASVTSGTGGSAVLNGNGTVTFTPDLNFNGAANFTYTVSDGLATSAAATVTVNVAAVNDAPTVAGLVVTETSISFVASDADNATLSLASPFASAFGNPTINSGSTTTLTPTQQAPAVSGTLQVTDGAATANVVGLYLGTSGNDFATVPLAGSPNAMYGFAGADFLTGGTGADSLYGGTGNDVLDGGGTLDTGNDTLLGGPGSDFLSQTQGNDSIDGGDGFDTLSFNDGVSGGVNVNLAMHLSTHGANVATVTAIENVTGTAGDDTLTGGDAIHGPDFLVNSITESFRPLGGNDVITGGTGNGFNTRADYSTNTSLQAVSVNLGTGTATDGIGGGVGGTDTLVRVDQVYGGSGNDSLLGGSQERSANGGFFELFRGNSGADTINGAGTDTVVGAAGTDRANYGSSPAAVIVNLGATPFVVGIDTVQGGTARDGFGFTDTLLNIDQVEGSIHNDTLVGGATNHRLIGGAGNDSLVGGASGVEASYQTGTAAVVASLATGTASDGQGGTDTLVTIDDLRGSDFNDNLTGNAANNRIIGDPGADTIDGGAGIDFASYSTTPLANGGITAFIENGSGAVNDGMGSIDTLTNIEGLIGTHSGDTLSGGLGDQWFIGRGGSDVIDGGAGSDWVIYIDDPAGVTVNLGSGLATDGWGGVWGFGGTDTLTSIENVQGSSFNDTLIGNDGDNVISGSGGSDSLVGGSGNDTYRIAPEDVQETDRIKINDASGIDHIIVVANGADLEEIGIERIGNDLVIAGGIVTVQSHYAGQPVEDIQFEGGASAFGYALGTATYNLATSLTGGSGNDVIAGTSAAETLDGGSGSDLLFGNGGNDVLIGGDGNDLMAGGTGQDSMDGGASDDTIVMLVSAGNFDVTDGGADTDTLALGGVVPGTGVVTVDLSSLTDQVTSIGGAPDSESLVQKNFENLDASGLGSSVNATGSSGDNVIIGSNGNDTLSGGAGDDTLDGGAGSGDRISFSDSTVAGVGINFTLVQSSSDTVVNLSTVGLGTDTYRNIEGVVGTNFADTLTGSSGNDVIGGGAGNDMLAGGVGTDTLDYTDSPARVIVNMFNNSTVTVGAVSVTPATASDGFGSTDTLSGFENVIGSNFDDYIQGTSNIANRLEGGAGNDTLAGSGTADSVAGAMDDTLVGGAGNDVLRQTRGHDSIDGGAEFDRLEFVGNGINYAGFIGVNVNLGAGTSDADPNNGDTVNGAGGDIATVSGIEHVLGTAGNDTLTGDANANLLDGQGGNDTLMGGAGNDTIDGGAGSDRINFADATGGINFTLNQGTNPGDPANGLWSSGALAGIGTDFYKNIEGVFGSNSADTLTGSSANDTIRGQGGADTIDAGAGNDIIRGGTGNDTIDGGGGDSDQISFADSTVAGVGINFTLVQGSSDTMVDLTSIGLGTDTYRNIEGVVGTSFNDTLTGSSGNDLIRGGAGDDTIFGGAGNDRIDFSDATAGISFTLNQGTNSGTFWSTGALSGIGTDLYMNIEGVVGTNFNDVLTGSAGSDSLLGGLGNDLLFQTLGNDTIDGGEDFDTLLFNDGVGGGVNVNLATHVSTHGANVATVTAIENVTGTAGDDTLTGGDAIHGPDFLGNNVGETFRPLDGNDVITGATGNGFTIRVDYSANTNLQAVSVNLGAGTASDGFGGTDTLVRIDQVYGGAGNDTLLGGGQERPAGGNFTEVFRGNSGADTIDGAGTDTVLGAAGADRVNYGTSPSAVIVNLGATPFVVGIDTVQGGTARDGFGFTDTLLNIDQVEGSIHNDTLVGGGTEHRLLGGAGNDVLVGNASGVEASYQNSTAAVVANLATGTATDGQGGTDTLMNIDDLRGGDFNDTLTGNAASNRIAGDAGADTIDGGGGIDFASYFNTPLANGGITAFIENGSGAVNDGMGSIDTLINIEGLIGTHSGDTLSGGSGDQWFIGRGGSDVIDGGAGSDWVSYINDPAGVTVNLNAGLATDGWGGVWGFGGTDTLTSIENVQGSNFNDNITGDINANLLDGSAGNDTLNGGAGLDSLTGGAGNDAFVYSAAPVAGNEKTVTDFLGHLQSGGDRVRLDAGQLTGLTANGTLDPSQFVLGASASATTDAQRILYNTATGEVFYDADGSGATAAVKILTLSGAPQVDASDFVVFNAAGGGTQFLWSTLTNGQVIAFNPLVDVLDFDDPAISAANIVGNATPAGTFVFYGGKTVLVQASPLAVTTTNVTFANGSLLLNGDNSTGTLNDDGPNTLVGGSGDDQLNGLGGADSLEGGVGNDLLAGQAGNDMLAGGVGTDTLDYTDSPARVIVNMFNNSTVTVGAVSVTPATASDGFGSTDTLSGFENVIGSNFDDYIQGTSNIANRLEGGAGNDTLAGSGTADSVAGAMDDTLVGGAGNDVLRQTRGHDSIDGGAEFDRLEFVGNGINYAGFIGVNVNLGAGTSDADPNNGDTVNGAGGDIATVSGIEHVLGTAGNDTLTGDANANLLDGQGGNDTLMGGAGNDTIDGGAGSDRINFADATGGINFTLNQGTNPGDPANGLWSSGALAGIGTDFYKNIEGVFGSNSADTLTGSSANDTIRGQGGADTIDAGAGNDIIRGGTGNDTIDGGGGDSDQISFADSTVAGVGINFTLVQGSSDTMVDLTSIGLGTDTYRNIEGVVGTSFNDTLTGSSGNDLIRGGAGDDTIFGGAGNDRIDFSDATAGISFTLNQGTNSGTFWSTGALSGIGTDLYMNIEGVVGTNFNDVLTGSAGSDSLLGGLGNDLLFQTLGNDTIDGGEDFDTLLFNDGVGGGVNVNLATHVSTHGANVATVTAIENVTGTAGDDTLTGGDAIHGPDFLGNNVGETFRPLDGNDVITGATGNGFTIRVDYSANTNLQAVSVNLGAGTASDGFGGTDTLVRIDQVYGGAGNDTLLGGGQERPAGGNFTEVFRGNSGADTIDGAGTDTVLGAAGADRVNYGTSPSAVIVNLGATPFVVGIDTVQGGTARDGFGFTDTLLNIDQVEGSIHNDTLVGGGTEHRLLGGAGNDVLVGNASGVEAWYQNSTAAVVANLATGTATDGQGGTDTLMNIDDLRGGDFNDTLTGNAASNRIAGDAGADTIDGGGGIDFASYFNTPLANGGITAFIENGSGAVNDGMGSIDTLINIEGLIGTHSGDTLSGGSGDQWFIGRGGSDVIDGGAGSDWVSYINDPAGVTVNLNAGLATDGWGGVWGFGGTDTLTSIENVQGSNFNDTLIGNSDDNTLTGSAGTDIMTGNAGSDTFKFNATSDSSTTLALSDLIKDFLHGIDKIDLSDIDANTGTGGDQDFAFVALANANTVANSITWSETGGGNTILQIDNNGDTAADMQIVLEGTGLGLTDADFIL